jgi:hypothetical protein
MEVFSFAMDYKCNPCADCCQEKSSSTAGRRRIGRIEAG